MDLMVGDIEVGVAGGVKAGIIGEVGMDHPMHPNEEKVLRASAKASVATGVALSVHPGFHPASPFDIVRVVDEAGGDLSRTVIDHCDSRFNTSAGTNVFDSGPLLELAKTGVYLAFDTFGWEGSVPPALSGRSAQRRHPAQLAEGGGPTPGIPTGCWSPPTSLSSTG